MPNDFFKRHKLKFLGSLFTIVVIGIIWISVFWNLEDPGSLPSNTTKTLKGNQQTNESQTGTILLSHGATISGHVWADQIDCLKEVKLLVDQVGVKMVLQPTEQPVIGSIRQSKRKKKWFDSFVVNNRERINAISQAVDGLGCEIEFVEGTWKDCNDVDRFCAKKGLVELRLADTDKMAIKRSSDGCNHLSVRGIDGCSMPIGGTEYWAFELFYDQKRSGIFVVMVGKDGKEKNADGKEKNADEKKNKSLGANENNPIGSHDALDSHGNSTVLRLTEPLNSAFLAEPTNLSSCILSLDPLQVTCKQHRPDRLADQWMDDLNFDLVVADWNAERLKFDLPRLERRESFCDGLWQFVYSADYSRMAVYPIGRQNEDGNGKVGSVDGKVECELDGKVESVDAKVNDKVNDKVC